MPTKFALDALLGINEGELHEKPAIFVFIDALGKKWKTEQWQDLDEWTITGTSPEPPAFFPTVIELPVEERLCDDMSHETICERVLPFEADDE
jgi:hypothetical protein